MSQENRNWEQEDPLTGSSGSRELLDHIGSKVQISIWC